MTGVSKDFASVCKSVSHPLIDSVRFMQVCYQFWYVRVKGQIEYAMRKDGTIPSCRGEKFMNVVGIDVSKGKSTVAVLCPFGELVAKPFNVSHTSTELSRLADKLKSLEG